MEIHLYQQMREKFLGKHQKETLKKFRVDELCESRAESFSFLISNNLEKSNNRRICKRFWKS